MAHFLSLCAVFKDEASYLHEFLHFYSLIGVEHFYLYNNQSTDAFAPILAPWESQKRLTLYAVAGRASQMPCYQHCIQNHARDTQWLMFVDLDEYLFAPGQPDLRTFLASHAAEAGVVANWLMFGSSGHRSPPAGLTTLNFTRRCPADLCTFEPALMKARGLNPADPASYHKVCDHVKSIVNTRDVVQPSFSPHHFIYKDGRRPVNALGRPVPGPFSADLQAIDLLRVNHYFSRSEEEFRRKLARGRSDTGGFYEADQMLARNRLFDQVEDRAIFPIAEKIPPSA